VPPLLRVSEESGVQTVIQMSEKSIKSVKRWNIPGHAHELTFTCFDKRQFLKSRKAREILADSILRAREKHGFDIWAYVFMPEHVHLLIYPLDAQYSMSRILFSIKQPVGRTIINQTRKKNPSNLRFFSTGQKDAPYRFWMPGGGYDRNMDSLEILNNAVEYLHRNPVRRGLVENPEDWYWSSYNEWIKPGTSPIPVDRDSYPAE
jgi:putative transposase